jgi:preprotein translocase subunit SecG
MGKKDIIILAVLFATIALNLYLRWVKKKKGASGTQKDNLPKKGSISGQPDDYEPYSKK